jgi:hypothetical protein
MAEVVDELVERVGRSRHGVRVGIADVVGSDRDLPPLRAAAKPLFRR